MTETTERKSAPSTTTPTSEQRAHALLDANSAASLYLRRGNFAQAKRKGERLVTGPTMLLRFGGISRSTKGGRKPNTLAQAAAHNLRADQQERGARAHIDPAKSHLNKILVGPSNPALVAALAQTKMAEAGIDASKLRKDYTQAIELMTSLPPSSGVDEERFFADAVAWVGRRYGDANILSAVVHRDEATPHCHVLLLPLVGGKMNGAALKTRQATQEALRDFYDAVAKPHGLRRMGRASSAQKADIVKAVLERLSTTNDPALRSAAWPAVRAAIEANPQPFAEGLGITLERRRKPLRSFTSIMTSQGRKTSEDRQRKAIAFTPLKVPKAALCSFRPKEAPETVQSKEEIDSLLKAQEPHGASCGIDTATAAKPDPFDDDYSNWHEVLTQ